MVTGPVAPSEGAGREWNAAPDSAMAMMAAVPVSMKRNGLTGDTAIEIGRWRSASAPPQQAVASATWYFTSSGLSAGAPETGLRVLRTRTSNDAVAISGLG